VPNVGDVMATRLQTVGPEDTVGEAVAVMAQNRVGSVLVMEGDRLLGIFTERDTVRALSQSHDAARHEIVSWMTHDPKTVEPDVDAEDALRTMLDNGFRHLPVVDHGKVVGIVSIRDLMRVALDDRSPRGV
jgi:CBS domain-containing protein